MYFWGARAGHLQPCYQEAGGIHQQSSFCGRERSAVAAVSPVSNVLSSIMITAGFVDLAGSIVYPDFIPQPTIGSMVARWVKSAKEHNVSIQRLADTWYG